MQRFLWVFAVPPLLLSIPLQTGNVQATENEALGQAAVKLLLVKPEDPDLAAENTDAVELTGFIEEIERLVLSYRFEDKKPRLLLVHTTLKPTESHESEFKTNCEEDLDKLSILSKEMTDLVSPRTKSAPVALQAYFGVNGKELPAEDLCGYRTLYDGTVFTLTIGRSFHKDVSFKLCKRKSPIKSFVLFESDEKTVTKEITESEYKTLHKLYEQALEYDVKDDSMGRDGSSWCLETRRGFTYSKACFWSPSYRSEARRLVGLEKLGRRLWEIKEFELSNDDLY